ncbi:MAG: succinic semialdehyde dehydrogenase [Gemmatimonadota bacterium]
MSEEARAGDPIRAPGPATSDVSTSRRSPDYLAASRLDDGRLSDLLAQASTDAAEFREVRLPWTEARLVDLPLNGAAGVREAVRRGRVAQAAWARVPVEERARRLLAFHDLVLERNEEALDLVQLETGKARRDAFEELADIAVVTRHYARKGAHLLRPRRRAGLIPFLTRVWELRRPHGVVGVIAPWNYPLTLAATDAAPALIAGNAVVVKPDPQTTLSALWIAEAMREAGVPRDIFQVTPGDGPVAGGAVVDAADFLMFTGSTATGREVARRAAGRLIGMTLELGGKNAMVVLEDADLDRAVHGALRGCFANAGQLCISLERIYVHRALYDDMRRALAGAVPNLVVRPGLDYEADVGSLLSATQLDKTRAHVEDATSRGAGVLVGGRRRPDLGPFFHEPTVLERVPEGAAARHEETFGPVAALYPVADEAEALARTNEGSYGFNASVWTRDLARGRRFAARVRAGTVNLNEGYAAAWGSVDAPMGGMGASGVGRRHGDEGLLQFTESQTIAAQTGHPLAAPAGVGHGTVAKAVLSTLRTVRRLRGP